MRKTATRQVHTKSTISDVAQKAGVSIKTVSRVLNREPKVKLETRERVEEAMRQLRYRPNSPGRMLAGRKSYILGLVYNANSSYITSIQSGALAACRREHYDLLIHPCLYRSNTLLDEITDLVTTGKVDGLLLLPPVADLPKVRKLVRELDIPAVTIARSHKSAGDHVVRTNDRETCAGLTRYLARLGHRDIAFVCGHPDHKAMANRHQGYLDGLRLSGIRSDDWLVAHGDNTFESGIECGRQLLSRKRRPTAVFCANDHMAAGMMNAAHELRLSIPGDVSVAGFDDIPLAKQVWPPLTTIRQPLKEMAEAAADMLIRLLRGASTSDIPDMLESELVIRSSTGDA